MGGCRTHITHAGLNVSVHVEATQKRGTNNLLAWGELQQSFKVADAIERLTKSTNIVYTTSW